jgi:hypothetical protein
LCVRANGRFSSHFLRFGLADQTRETAGRGRGSRLSAGRVRPGLTGGERFEKDLARLRFSCSLTRRTLMMMM